MNPLLSVVPSAAQLREFEKTCIEKRGSEWGLALMERAGSHTARVVHNLWLQAPAGAVVVLCGTGNNGADGMVVARCLGQQSVPVVLHRIESIRASEDDLGSVRQSLSTASVVVDALLGTGLDRPVEGLYQKLIEMMNACNKPVVAVDIPSGINSDTGQIMGTAVRAAATITFGYLKPGLIAYPAANLCGQLCLVDIGLPPIQLEQLGTAAPRTILSTREHAQAALPPRYADSHKGSYGTVLTVAGSASMSGAAELCSVSALRVGAGLSVLAGVEPVVRKLCAPEIIYRILPATAGGAMSRKARKQIEEAVADADSVIIGPGLSLEEETVQLVQGLVKEIKKPCVVDADALTAISKNSACFPAASAQNFVFTPHPGELSRLLNTDIKTLQSDRYKSVRTAAKQFGCTVMLKGSRTLIASSSGDVFVNSTGNPGMSTAGCGDVLSGIIAGLLAQGVDAYDAAVLGAYLHGAAGDIAAFNLGEVGILAGDISNFVPATISKIRSGEYPGSLLEVQLVSEPFISR